WGTDRPRGEKYSSLRLIRLNSVNTGLRIKSDDHRTLAFDQGFAVGADVQQQRRTICFVFCATVFGRSLASANLTLGADDLVGAIRGVAFEVWHNQTSRQLGHTNS